MVGTKLVKGNIDKKLLNTGEIIRVVKMSRSRSYRDDLLKALTDPIEASEYLNTVLEDGNLEVFI